MQAIAANHGTVLVLVLLLLLLDNGTSVTNGRLRANTAPLSCQRTRRCPSIARLFGGWKAVKQGAITFNHVRIIAQFRMDISQSQPRATGGGKQAEEWMWPSVGARKCPELLAREAYGRIDLLEVLIRVRDRLLHLD